VKITLVEGMLIICVVSVCLGMLLNWSVNILWLIVVVLLVVYALLDAVLKEDKRYVD
jgi:hypothetical protein